MKKSLWWVLTRGALKVIQCKRLQLDGDHPRDAGLCFFGSGGVIAIAGVEVEVINKLSLLFQLNLDGRRDG